MSNVISFPAEKAPEQQTYRTTGAQTLFLHVKNATMIVHLGAPHKVQGTDERVGKTT